MYRPMVLLSLASAAFSMLVPAPAAMGQRVTSRQAWSRTGSMHQGRFGHTAVLLRSGEVLVAGGDAVGKIPLATDIYNPVTGTWRSTGQLRGPHSLATMTLLANGSVLLAGGGATVSAELYNPASGQWVGAHSRWH
jgi:hypothetical protein